MSKIRKLCLVGVALSLVGCASSVTVTPAERALINDQYVNAAAFSGTVNNDGAVPQYVKDWLVSDVKSWQAFNAWANGQDVGGNE